MPSVEPLQGYRVLEMGGGAAAIAGRVLAGLGARVIRLEPPGGDPLAASDPRFDVAPRYAWYTLGKETVTLDPATDPGAVRTALADIDLLIDGHRPGQLAAWGLDPAALREAFPHLIILSLSHYGQSGPYRDRAGSALTSFALGGSLFRAGRPSEPPLPPPVELADTIGGVTGALAAVTALVARGRDGSGDWIDCSVAESCLATSDWAVPMRSLAGTTTKRDGSGPLYPVYQAADGFVRVVNLSPKQWSAFTAWLGGPEEFAAPEWGNLLFRLANADVIDLVFARETAGRTREDLFHSGQRAGVSVVPVYAPEEIAVDAHFTERRALAEVTDPALGTVRVPRAFVRFDGTVPEAPRPASRLARIPDGGRFREDVAGLDFRALKVVELGSGGVAPEASRYFALLGADVVKVESPTALDFLRAAAGPGMHEYSPPFASSNRNKRSVQLDLKTEEGRAALARLLAVADVFFENNSGGVCERLGAGYEAVAATNPGIVYASSQLLGATGAAAAYSGFGPSNQAVGGISALWTHPDNPRPEGVSLVHPDHLAGKMLALAALAALGERRRTGRGRRIDLAQAEFAMATIGEAFVEASLLGRSVRRGHDHPAFVPHGVYPTLLPDEWVAVAVETDEQWQGLRRALGEPQWAADPALDRAAGRIAARRQIDEGLSAWTSGKTRTAVAHALGAAGVPAMPVLAPVEQIADPHLAARGAFDLVHHPLAGWAWMEGLPFRFQRLQVEPSRRAPLLGEHTDAVLAEWLPIPAAAAR
jgi:crotonobetainyl-CoA:carnitine CoA-transferase CaiB-like acyl-CoA transferase